MNNVFISSRINRLAITVVYFSVGAILVLYSENFPVFFQPQSDIDEHSSGTCYWCFIVLSSSLLYLLLHYWNAAKTEAQQSLGKVNRALRSHSGCAKAMVKAENETTLIRETCRICVEVRGHRMAWVAFAENDPQKTLRVETHWGDGVCFFESFEKTWSSTDSQQRPAEISIQTGEPVIFQNIMTDPRYEHCRETAKKCNYASCISLPLKDEQHTFGALVIFDTNPRAFDKEEALLLEELAGDLSYGIITLRLRAERKQEMEERLMLAAVTEQASDGVITFNPSGTIEYLNPSFINLCGIPENEGVGVSIHDFECSKRNPEFYQAVKGTLETNVIRVGHFVNKDRSGNEHDIDARIAPVFNKFGQVVRYVVTVRDISQEVKLQRQLRQAQKMEALSALSSGIGSDFNNILATIMTHSEEGIIADNEGKSTQDSLLMIHKAALRGKKTIKRFMASTKQDERSTQPLDIAEVVRESTKLFKAALPSTVQLKTDITPGLGQISGDQKQIHQVIMNLCNNAKDAMQATGGILEIGLTNVEIPMEHKHHYPDLIPGNHVKLTITDTGHGIDREEMEHIFEPFHTTKGQGSERGLGLTIAYGIIKNHGGIIDVNSVVGVGSTFVILLPLMKTTSDQVEKYRETESHQENQPILT